MLTKIETKEDPGFCQVSLVGAREFCNVREISYHTVSAPEFLLFLISFCINESGQVSSSPDETKPE